VTILVGTIISFIGFILALNLNRQMILSLLQKCSELNGQFLSDAPMGSFLQPETNLRS